MDTYLQLKRNFQESLERLDIAGMKAEGDRSRANVLRNLASVGPPRQFRLIDCKSTTEGKKVVLRDWQGLAAGTAGYTAISHTSFGMDDVYTVFNCQCASACLAEVPRCSPREPCPGHHDDRHWKTVGDILKMCEILMTAGAEYAWHDGVCIAQHDRAEVEESMKHMGWIYGYAKETVIFLHYVGNPIAPIRHDPHPVTGDLGSRWHTRVWTIQEAALSTHRRYCVRRMTDSSDLGQCESLQELGDKIANWYKDDKTIAVIEEDEYWELLLGLHRVLLSLLKDAYQRSGQWWMNVDHAKTAKWLDCLRGCIHALHSTCFLFPSMDLVLPICSERDSKYEGDRINSILALAEVRDFVVPMAPQNMETWTVEFFKRQDQQRLAIAVFSVNTTWEPHLQVPQFSIFSQLWSLATRCFRFGKEAQVGCKSHSWVPNLSKPLKSSSHGSPDEKAHAMRITNFIQYKVLCDGKMQLRGEMASVAVQFTLITNDGVSNDLKQQQHQQHQQQGCLAMDLRFVSGSFKAFARQGGVSRPMGEAVISFGTSFLPVIEGREIKNEESFSAHLVFPAAGLQLHPDGLLVAPQLVYMQRYWSVPGLLVTGRLGLPLFKVGFFYLYQELRHILEMNPTLITCMLHKLVII